MNRRWVLLGLLGVAACATTPTRLPPPRLLTPAGATLPELEPLHLAWPTEEGLIIRVASKGCTAKADMRFYLERPTGGGPARLAFGRARVDAYRIPPGSAAGQVDLAFTWSELGLPPGSQVVLLNPLMIAPGA